MYALSCNLPVAARAAAASSDAEVTDRPSALAIFERSVQLHKINETSYSP